MGNHLTNHIDAVVVLIIGISARTAEFFFGRRKRTLSNEETAFTLYQKVLQALADCEANTLQLQESNRELRAEVAAIQVELAMLKARMP